MVSLAARKRAAVALLKRGFPRTCACRVVAVSRNGSRSAPKERNPELREQVVQVARANPRYGSRWVHASLPGVNIKAVHRIWKLKGLRLSRKIRRKLKVAKMEAVELTAPNQAWCMDFACQGLENGRQASILAMVDCFTRECLLLKAAPSFPGFEVQRDLEWLFLVYGKPGRIVSDNGPEFRSKELLGWAKAKGVELAFSQPGKPQQNGFVESFHSRFRYECLSPHRFTDIHHAERFIEEWREEYNDRCPHSSLGGQPPRSRMFSR